MIVSLFWTPNIWGWTSNHLTLFYALLFVLGANVKQESHHRKWLLITGLGLLITVVLQGIMPFMSIDGQTASRFTTPTNIFTILATYGIIKITVNHLEQPNWRSLYSYLTLIENTALLGKRPTHRETSQRLWQLEGGNDYNYFSPFCLSMFLHLVWIING